MPRPLLSAHEFRAWIVSRGWTLSEVAARWGLSPARISQLINDPEARPDYWEDALFGLPHKSAAIRAERQRLAMARAAAATVTPRKAYGEGRPWVAQASHLDPGSVFVVTEEQGEHLPEGARGAILARRALPRPQVCLGFATGYLEWVDCAWLDTPLCWLQYIGTTAPAFAAFVYSSDAHAEAALRRGELRLP